MTPFSPANGLCLQLVEPPHVEVRLVLWAGIFLDRSINDEEVIAGQGHCSECRGTTANYAETVYRLQPDSGTEDRLRYRRGYRLEVLEEDNAADQELITRMRALVDGRRSREKR